jgi:hypothetical protein
MASEHLDAMAALQELPSYEEERQRAAASATGGAASGVLAVSGPNDGPPPPSSLLAQLLTFVVERARGGPQAEERFINLAYFYSLQENGRLLLGTKRFVLQQLMAALEARLELPPQQPLKIKIAKLPPANATSPQAAAVMSPFSARDMEVQRRCALALLNIAKSPHLRPNLRALENRMAVAAAHPLPHAAVLLQALALLPGG